MNGIPLSMIFILVHNDDNLDSLWMIQTTNGNNDKWSNIIIINALNADIPVWGLIDNSNILSRNHPH